MIIYKIIAGPLIQKIFLLLVFCFLNNNLSASDDSLKTSDYDAQKTAALVAHMTRLNNMMMSPTRKDTISLALKRTFHLKLPSTQAKELIEQGADPQQLKFFLFEPGLESTLIIPNLKLTELCLKDACKNNYQPNKHLPGSMWCTSLHMLCLFLCNRPANLQAKLGLLEKTALLRFFGADVTIQDEDGKTARDVLVAHKPAIAPAFDATITATDFVRTVQKEKIVAARSPLLLKHLPVTDVVTLVHKFSDDAEWDNTCLPAIQEQVARITNKPIPMPRTRWDFIMRRRR